MKKKITTHAMVTMAMLVALSIVLRLLGFPQRGTVRFEFGFLPIAVIGEMYGGIWGGLAYVIADIIGTFLSGSTPFWSITICKFLLGFIFGLFFHKKKVTFLRAFACALFVGVFVDLIAMPFALLPLYPGKGLWAILYQRLLMSFVNVPTRTIAIYVTYKYLGGFIENHIKRGNKNN